jgi:hemoglobin-like flavoprotein
MVALAGGKPLDPGCLRDSFARVAMHGDAVALFFYSDLFLRHPETRELFPVSMAAQRDRLLNALGRVVAEADRLEELAHFLPDLGRDHRKVGALADHYGPVGESLPATLAHFSGPDWTRELAAEWTAAYQHDAYLAGPTGMTDAVSRRLLSLGVPDRQIHVEDFGWSEP